MVETVGCRYSATQHASDLLIRHRFRGLPGSIEKVKRFAECSSFPTLIAIVILSLEHPPYYGLV